ncbi:outer membrane transport energization protein ExbD [Tistlia consotensis]|uniref:Outer membrane transport energization protein ExbD n=1 Tax=Tistlia consotensis USBA 355 TaxID=560819 RepID=A0A1Y6BUJ6_9PROT|nr:biopolymer transporter ExbD [Tistlia consotensis]SMF19332.1 outer membrane transport energization protein ExbD [Tistlia consotensis USBA 355]SNR39026.1 outer membrane transport energization protein ExbD [Tistlia consotensis]
MVRSVNRSLGSGKHQLSTKAGAGARRRALISLTPLIDVVFILLIFFMLASSFLDWRSIDLDAPGRTGAGSSVEGALLVELRPEGLRLSGTPIAPEELSRRVAALLAERPDQKVLLRPAPGVALQDAVAVLDRLTAAGVTALSLIRSP